MTSANGHGHQDHGHAAPRRSNIHNIVDLENAALARRSPTERLSEAIQRRRAEVVHEKLGPR